MKIGILGTRGIPNAYGGFEQFAQYLAEGLTAKGHDVSVYNSSTHPYKQDNWMGIKLIHCKDWENKIGTAGQFVYDLNCINDSRKRNFDGINGAAGIVYKLRTNGRCQAARLQSSESPVRWHGCTAKTIGIATIG